MRYLLDTNLIIEAVGGSEKAVDAIIAATAIEHNATLVTRNENDFKNIKTLAVHNPWR